MKLGLGNTRTVTTINGSTTFTEPNQPPAQHNAGLFALSSNSGSFTGNQFSIMPELGFTLGYDITCRLRATVGYSFIYWTQVRRAGEQIDTNINPNLFPVAITATGAATAGPQQPQFHNDTPLNEFWAQGVNFGLQYSF